MQASPNRRPARNWRGRSEDERRARLATPAAACRARSARAGRRLVRVLVRQVVLVDRGVADRRRARRRRQRAPARPPGRGPGTTSSPSWAEYQNTVPKAKKTVVATRTPPDRQPAEHPPGEPDVDRAEDREDQLAVGGEAPQRDERQEHDRRQRRERNVAARHAVGRLDRADVLEEGVARARVRSSRPGSGSPSGPRGTPGPATRSGRRSGTAGRRCRRPGPSARAQSDRDRAAIDAAGTASTAGASVGVVTVGWLRSTLCYPAIHLNARPGGHLRLTGPRIGRAEPGRGRADADHLDAGWRRRDPRRPRARRSPLRLIIAYALPGTGLQVRPRTPSSAGRRTSPRDGLYGFYERDFFHDYTPGYLYVLYARRAASGRRSAASAT